MPKDEEVIQEQQDFVVWLKSKGIYNPYASAAVMRFGHEVWAASGKPKAN